MDDVAARGNAVFAVSIAPPHHPTSFLRAMVDVRSFWKRLLTTRAWRSLAVGGIAHLEPKFPCHPHLHLLIEAAPDVERWLPDLRTLVSRKASQRVPDHVLANTVDASAVDGLDAAAKFLRYSVKPHADNGFSTLSAEEVEAVLPILDFFNVRKTTFGKWRGVVDNRPPSQRSHRRRRADLGSAATPLDIVIEDLSFLATEKVREDERGNTWRLVDWRTKPVAEAEVVRLRQGQPRSKLRRADLQNRRQR